MAQGEYFPATNTFLRSLTDPSPPPAPAERSASTAGAVNWRLPGEPRTASFEVAPPPPPPAASPPEPAPETSTRYHYTPTPRQKRFKQRSFSTLHLAAPQGVAGYFETMGWMCCIADNRTSSRPRGTYRFHDAMALIPVKTREDAHLFREKVTKQTAAGDGFVFDAEDAEGRTLLWHAALHDDVQSAKVLLEHGCAHLILEPDYVHRLSPLQLAEQHSRRDMAGLFSAFVSSRDIDEHWHHGRLGHASP